MILNKYTVRLTYTYVLEEWSSSLPLQIFSLCPPSASLSLLIPPSPFQSHHNPACREQPLTLLLTNNSVFDARLTAARRWERTTVALPSAQPSSNLPVSNFGVLLLSPSPREARDILDFKCSGTGIGAPNDYVDFI